MISFLLSHLVKWEPQVIICPAEEFGLVGLSCQGIVAEWDSYIIRHVEALQSSGTWTLLFLLRHTVVENTPVLGGELSTRF